MLTMTTWNVNSVRQRLPHLLRFLAEVKPDLVCIQELKCQTEDAPVEALREAGYHVTIHGQKAYNGVAILTRAPHTEVARALPALPDDPQARVLEVEYQGVRVLGFYAPNGNPLGTEKFTYKLAWLAALEARVDGLMAQGLPFLLMGDFNIIPTALDCRTPDDWQNDALYSAEARAVYRRLLYRGLTDAVRLFAPDTACYTFWDYQAGAWPRDNGIRIDHILLSPALADAAQAATIARDMRGWENPSDHVPVSVEIGAWAMPPLLGAAAHG